MFNREKTTDACYWTLLKVSNMHGVYLAADARSSCAHTHIRAGGSVLL